MATKTELKISREKITLARFILTGIENWSDHARSIGAFWRDVIEGWKYPQGQDRHGGRCWRKRMDEQITMELADLNTYWPTMLAQLDQLDALHAVIHAELSRAIEKLDGLDGRADLSTVGDVQSKIRTARTILKQAICLREFGNIDGETETEL